MLADIEALIGQVIDRKVQPGYEEGAPLPERYRQLLVEPKAKKTFKHKSRSKANAPRVKVATRQGVRISLGSKQSS